MTLKLTEVKYQLSVLEWMKVYGFETQVHNDVGHPYVPDVSFSGHGTEGWIELKWCNDRPKTVNHIEHFTKGQENWLRRHGRAGLGNCFLWIGTPDAHFIVRHSTITKAWRAMPFNEAMKQAFVLDVSLSTTVKQFYRSLSQPF